MVVLEKISQDFGVAVSTPLTANHNAHNWVSIETKKKVLSFYHQDDISRQLSGKKNVMIVKHWWKIDSAKASAHVQLVWGIWTF